MKKVFIILLIFLSLGVVACNAFPKPLMIEKLELCTVMCVDFDDGEYTLSLGIKMISQSSGDGNGADKDTEVAKASHTNLSEALSKVVASRTLNVYFGDIDTIVLGNGIMSEGIDKVIDFFLRSDKFNQYAHVYAVTTKAEDLIDDMVESNMIDAVEQKINMDASKVYTKEQRLIDIIALLQDKSSGVIPLIKEVVDGDKKAFELEGLSVIKNKKQVGVLNRQESRGYNAVVNNINNATLGIELDGYKAGVDNLDIKTRLKVSVNNEHLSVTINNKQVASIAYITDSVKNNVEVERAIEKKVSESIKDDISACLQKVKDYQSDFLGILDRFRMWNKREYDRLIWGDIDGLLFNMSFEINSNTNIERAHQVM